ncbi:hypothetical protein AX774_g3426 [Zancudomyces culisetae]|uniref:Uncharacterized protein n=1 Tax=Zancudomyces culisetae TaxID=1213189 RepID=A0A1R1PQ59_ZANCU|nr:hypothetical protein AX774_g3426 [Zancudomyces culisetae]|eukprot:OMH83088.1 hypothetical protein AX774_g3426 [Zancudomyces culisetae]
MPLLASVTNSVVEVWELSDPSGHDSNPNLSRKGNKFTNKKTGVKHKNIKGLLPSAVSAPFGSIKSFFKLDKTGKTAGPSTNLSGPAKSPKPSRLQSIKRTMRSETPPQKHTKLVKKRSPSQNERYSPQRQGQVQGQYHGLELVGHGPEYSNQNQNPNEYLPAPGGVGIGLGLEPEERKVSDTTESTNKSNTDSSIKNSIIFEPFFYLNHNNYCDLITSITWSLKGK